MSFRLGHELPVRLTRRRQRFHGKALRHEGQTMAARDAETIVEVDRLATGSAGKSFIHETLAVDELGESEYMRPR